MMQQGAENAQRANKNRGCFERFSLNLLSSRISLNFVSLRDSAEQEAETVGNHCTGYTRMGCCGVQQVGVQRSTVRSEEVPRKDAHVFSVRRTSDDMNNDTLKVVGEDLVQGFTEEVFGFGFGLHQLPQRVIQSMMWSPRVSAQTPQKHDTQQRWKMMDFPCHLLNVPFVFFSVGSSNSTRRFRTSASAS